MIKSIFIATVIFVICKRNTAMALSSINAFECYHPDGSFNPLTVLIHDPISSGTTTIDFLNNQYGTIIGRVDSYNQASSSFNGTCLVQSYRSTIPDPRGPSYLPIYAPGSNIFDLEQYMTIYSSQFGDGYYYSYDQQKNIMFWSYFNNTVEFRDSPMPSRVSVCTIDCNDNVLFLPGIEGSHLYKPRSVVGEEQLWEPNIDSDVQYLYMNSNGSISRTGKVTIVAHSNGGLVAKELINKLVSLGKGGLVDKLVMVAVPQLGTLKAIPVLLHRYDQAIGKGFILSQPTARTLAQNLPDAYYLLPSAQYTHLVASPVVTFDQGAQTTQYFRSIYGTSISDKINLDKFFKGLDGRSQGNPNDTNVPLTANTSLLLLANTEHNTVLDAWTAPSNLKVYQLAETGVETLTTTNYTDDCSFYCIFSAPHLHIEPINVFDGDGTGINPQFMP